MTETIIQLETVEDGHLDAVFWLLGVLSICIVWVIIVLADRIAGLFAEPQVATYLVWATPAVLFLGFSGVPVACLRRRLEFRNLAIRATLGVLAGGAVGISMALADLGPWSLIAQHVTLVLVNGLVAWIAYPWRPGFRIRRRHLHDVFTFSTKMVSLRVAELLSLNAPTVVIGAYLGPVPLGQFTLAWRLVEILSLVLTTPIRFVAQPAFAHLHRQQRRAGQLLRQVMDASSLVTFVSFLGLAAVGAPAIRYIFGDEWMPAVPVLQVLCVLGIYLSLERLQQAFCIALGQTDWLIPLSLAEAALATGAMIYLADHGLVGVASAFPAALLVLWPLRIWRVTRIAHVEMLDYLTVFRLPCILAVLTSAVVVIWQAGMTRYVSTLPLLASSILLGVAVYAAGAWFTMRQRLLALLSSMELMQDTSARGAAVP